MEREYASQSQDSQRDDAPEVQAPPVTRNVSDISDLLADIDTVLEENAQDFVKNFIQKGGQ